MLVETEGKFSPDFYCVSKNKDNRLGFNILQTFTPKEANFQVLVNRGWIPGNHKEQISKELSQKCSANEKVTGIVKKSEHFEIRKKQIDFFRNSDKLEFVDLETISQKSNGKISGVFYIDEFISDNSVVDKLYPHKSSRSTYTAPYLTPRKHVEYAVFWGLSTLIGISGIKRSLKFK